MNNSKIEPIIEKIKSAKIAVYGDFSLDAYWILDPNGGEISRETGLKTNAVKKHYYTLGGAANVVANLAALKPKVIKAVGVHGNDIFGKELLRKLEALGVDNSGMIAQEENFDTFTFGKPYLEDKEQSRVDFGFFNVRSDKTDTLLLELIESALEECDSLIFNQQVPNSITNISFIKRFNDIVLKYNDKIILIDSRHYNGKFDNVFLKTNDIEAARLCGVNAALDDVISVAELKCFAQKLFEKQGKPVFITRGSRGMVIAHCNGLSEIPGIQVLKKIDPVGAGDTTTSTIALALSAGAGPVEAAEFANFAAAVTVQKLYQTGTASPEEILEISRDADYIYQPELAEDIRQASYITDTESELCCPIESVSLGKVRHAVFDHDGTISTLRQGWEQVMEPMMIKAVLGEQYEQADETLYHKALNRMRDYIDKSTGIQTILQMEALVEMVEEFGIVNSDEILDKFGYKEIYNNALIEMVNRRIQKFKIGELDIYDFTMKGAVHFLKELKDRGVKLYLASGTDRDDVINEAKVLGYADLFDGGIYGAVGDVSKYSKKMVIDNIMLENGLEGPEVAVFGDGPVEIRESRKRNGIAVGIASDEIRRHGLNKEKRTRLIKAGAHIIIPDFSQYHKLLELLIHL